jgi:hypothetical protein
MGDVKILRSCFESPATKIEAINVFLCFLPPTHIMSTSALRARNEPDYLHM